MKKLLLLLAILYPNLLFAQGGVINGPIQILGSTGRPLAGATITFCTSAGIGLPCSPLASIFTDPGLTIPATNPTVTDGLGNIPQVYAGPGIYKISVMGSGITPTLITGSVAGTGGGNVVLGANAGSISFTGTESDAGGTHSGTEAFNGALNTTAGGSLAGTFSGGPTLTGPWTFGGNVTATAGRNILTFYSTFGSAVLYWDGNQYTYDTPGLQGILSDCLASAVCGQVHLETAGVRTTNISSTTSFGSTTKSLTVYCERSWNPNCTMTNNTDCFVIHAGTTFTGNGEVPITANQGMTAASNASVSAMVRLIDQDGTNNVGGLFEGFTIVPNATMTVSDAILSVQNALQVKVIRNVTVSTPPTGVVGVKIFNTAGKGGGNISLENVQFNGGAPPLWIGCANVGSLTLVSCIGTPGTSINGSASSIVHAQSGFPIIDLEAGNGAGGSNSGAALLNVNDLQIESSASNTVGILCNGCNNLKVNSLFASATVAGADVVKIAQTAGTVADGINLTGITNQGQWTNTVNNAVISDTVPFASCANGCNYRYTKAGANAVSSNVWADGSGRQATIDTNGITATRGFAAIGNGKGLQLFNATTTCTTGASVGATCTTAAITLPVAEADTAYRVVCTGKGPTAVPVVTTTANSSATQFTITIAALTAVAASFASYDCTVGHN